MSCACQTGLSYLTISTGHPDFSKGGAETAAYNLHCWYQRQENCRQATLLCRSGRGTHGTISLYRSDEYLWDQGISDWFTFSSQTLSAVTESLREFLKFIKPDIVHVHHFAHLGLETLTVVRQTLPQCRILFTLHEYQAICHRQGQMLKTGTNSLCYKSSPEECHRCFPEFSEGRFWAREHLLKEAFENVDEFISPSFFLRDRYLAWGLDPDKIVVRENEQIPVTKLPPRHLENGETRNRFAFFGQINPYKGLDLLLRSVLSMTKKDRKSLHLEIHGTNLDLWGSEFQDLIHGLATPLIEEGCVQWVGPYEQRDLVARMANIDWVVVPSIWWENSPMVIQEAKKLGRKLIVADIGGMAEKVIDGVDGWHFQAGNIFDLANKILKASRLRTSETLV